MALQPPVDQPLTAACQATAPVCCDTPETGWLGASGCVRLELRARGPLREVELGSDLDGPADALRDRAPRGVEAVRSLRRLALVIGASGQPIAHSDALDHEDLVLEHHVALRLRCQPAAAGIDLARLQRASQGSC